MGAGNSANSFGQNVRLAKRSNAFFLTASALMTLIVFLGFLPSFYFRPHFRTTPLPSHLLLHGMIMTAWQLLFFCQALLIATGKFKQHRRLGYFGAALALAVVAAGVHAVLKQPAFYAELGEAPPFPMEILVVGNIFGFGLFATLVAAAIALRRDTASHRRLMYWACIVTIGPALTPGRSLGAFIVPYFPATFPPEIALGWISWIALLIHDWRTARFFHPSTVVGGMLILFVAPALLDWLLQIRSVSTWVQSLAIG